MKLLPGSRRQGSIHWRYEGSDRERQQPGRGRQPESVRGARSALRQVRGSLPRDPARLNEAERDAFAAELTPGPITSGGQDWLKTAFTSYFAAARAKTPKAAAEFILHGNLLIGLHEQTRLQPCIAGAIDAPFQPSSYEDLGEDVPVGAHAFPPVLEPLEYAELIRLIETYDPHLDSLKGSGAKNWVLIENRMAFSADLFRSRQQDASSFDQPFTTEQLAVMAQGKVPPGPL